MKDAKEEDKQSWVFKLDNNSPLNKQNSKE